MRKVRYETLQTDDAIPPLLCSVADVAVCGSSPGLVGVSAAAVLGLHGLVFAAGHILVLDVFAPALTEGCIGSLLLRVLLHMLLHFELLLCLLLSRTFGGAVF
ncbi:hypothetical protein LXL04_012663 [Taraxacum kok-saghyz]